MDGPALQGLTNCNDIMKHDKWKRDAYGGSSCGLVVVEIAADVY